MRHKIIGVTPFIAVFIFLLIGFTKDVWHPTWLVFMSVPIVGAFLATENIKDAIMGGTTLIVVTIFMAVPLLSEIPWHLSAFIFLFVPIVGVILYSE